MSTTTTPTSSERMAFETVGFADSIPAGRDRDIPVARQAGPLLDVSDTRPDVQADSFEGVVEQLLGST